VANLALAALAFGQFHHQGDRDSQRPRCFPASVSGLFLRCSSNCRNESSLLRSVRGLLARREATRDIFRRPSGARCGSATAAAVRFAEISAAALTGFLEFHHLVPYAKGGTATSENIELRCRAHNAYEAEQHFTHRPPSLFVRETRADYRSEPTRSGPSVRNTFPGHVRNRARASCGCCNERSVQCKPRFPAKPMRARVPNFLLAVSTERRG
jgi:hypothetical protein